MFKLSTALLLLTNLYQAHAGLNPTSGYSYSATQSGGQYDWNISVADEDILAIQEELDQGIFKLTTNITLDDQHYDVEFYKYNCDEAADPLFPITFVTSENTNTIAGGINVAHLVFEYNQTMVQESDIWTANKTGGNVYFCLRINNYLDSGSDDFGIPIHFLEINYKIEVDSLTDYETTIDISRDSAKDGGIETIDYEEEIEAYACDDSYAPVSLIYSQGDAVCICVETVDGSAFAVHSIKEMTVSQISDADDSLFVDYDYVNGFIDSPLAESSCIDSNTTDAICKSKIQLIAGFFIEEQIFDSDSTLDVTGVVKLDYVGGRRLIVDVPIRLQDKTGDAVVSRATEETEEAKSFGTKIAIESNEAGMSSANTVTALSAAAVAAAAGIFALV